MQRDDHSITPSVSDSGVTTAPTLTAEEEIRELRNEVQRLRSLLQKIEKRGIALIGHNLSNTTNNPMQGLVYLESPRIGRASAPLLILNTYPNQQRISELSSTISIVGVIASSARL